jgi:hypothetical protein
LALGTGPSQKRLTSREAQRLAEQDAAIAQARLDAVDLLEGVDELIAEIDDLLVDRPFLTAFLQWDGE